MDNLILLLQFDVGSHNPLVPGSSPGGPARKINPYQKWWGFCHLSNTLCIAGHARTVYANSIEKNALVLQGGFKSPLHSLFHGL